MPCVPCVLCVVLSAPFTGGEANSEAQSPGPSASAAENRGQDCGPGATAGASHHARCSSWGWTAQGRTAGCKRAGPLGILEQPRMNTMHLMENPLYSKIGGTKCVYVRKIRHIPEYNIEFVLNVKM